MQNDLAKKALSGIATIALVIGLCPASALAAGVDGALRPADATGAGPSHPDRQNTIVVEAPVQTITVDAELLADSSELLDGYAQMRLDEALPNAAPMSSQGLPRDNTLTRDETTLLNLLEEKVRAVANGKQSSTVFEFSVDELDSMKKTWTSEELGIDIIIRNDAGETPINNAAIAKAEESLPSLDKIISALCVDCPYELYWFDKTGNSIISPGQWSASAVGDEETLTFVGPISISLSVASEYQDTSKENSAFEVSTTHADTIKTAIEEANTIVVANAGKKLPQMLEGFKDAICERTSYNHDAAAGKEPYNVYGNPWQLIWVFDNDPNTTVVCEGYAKAFEYLCDLSGQNIDCYTVSGTLTSHSDAKTPPAGEDEDANGGESDNASEDEDADGGESDNAGEGGAEDDSEPEIEGGAHMWNIVSMDDGLNYLVDVTNCDEGTIGHPDILFMAYNPQGSVADGYTFAIGDKSNTTLTYRYDNVTRSLMNEASLTIASHEYTEPGTRTSLDGATVTVPAAADYNYTYDGTEKKPKVSVTIREEDSDTPKDLVEGVDFTVAYSDNVNAGTATFTVMGTGAYIGTIEGYFGITTASIEGASVTAEPSDCIYDRQEKKPAITVTHNGRTLSASVDYEILNYAQNVNAGEASVTLSGKGNYNGTTTATFTIEKASVQVPPAKTGLVYNGAEQTGVAAGNGFTVSGGTGTDARDYEATAHLYDTDNYKWADGTAEDKTVAWSIAPAPISEATVETSPSSFVYNGNAMTPAVTTVRLGDKELTTGDYEVVRYTDNVNAGEASVVVKGTGNYTNEAKGTFTISKAPVVIPSATTGLVYNGATQTGIADGEGFTVSGGTGTGAGSYTATARLADAVNHEWADGTAAAKSISWSIDPLSISGATVTTNPSSFVYDGLAKTPTVTVTLGGKELAADDYGISYVDNKDAGTARVMAVGRGNYTDKAWGSFTIQGGPAPSQPTSTETETAPEGQTSSEKSETSSTPTSPSASGAQATPSQPGETGEATSESPSGEPEGQSADPSTGEQAQGASSGQGAAQQPAESERKVMHRLYNPWSGEHFYTSDEAEYENVVAAGWTDEGQGWTAPETSNTPVFRMYNKWGGEHHYCMTIEERDTLVEAGWDYEGIGWYSDDAQTTPLYREYNPYEYSNNHNYTTNKTEHDNLIILGWVDEGYAWYGI